MSVDLLLHCVVAGEFLCPFCCGTCTYLRNLTCDYQVSKLGVSSWLVKLNRNESQSTTVMSIAMKTTYSQRTCKCIEPVQCPAYVCILLQFAQFALTTQVGALFLCYAVHMVDGTPLRTVALGHLVRQSESISIKSTNSRRRFSLNSSSASWLASPPSSATRCCSRPCSCPVCS